LVSFVLDNSVALSWCFEDERTEETAALLQRAADEGAVVPALWPLEAVNGLLIAQRRGRLDTIRRDRLIRFLQALPITIDHEGTQQVWTATAELAEQFRLSAYDAAYLEVADRRGLPLASLHGALRTAAATLGVPLLP
jgi:predicted nucleic acid-binding protein